jgi:hypothetical protein
MKMWNKVCQPIPDNWPTWCMSNKPDQVGFALFGDSHAEHYLPGLLGPGTSSDGWLFIGRSGCPPVLNVDILQQGVAVHCDEENAWAQVVLDRDHDIKTVVMSSLTTPYFMPNPPSAYSRDSVFQLTSNGYRGSSEDIYYQGLAGMVSNLLTAGKRVVIMIDTPELNFELGRCVANRRLQFLLAGRKALPCYVTRAEYLERNQEYRRMVARLKENYPAILVYDPIDLFCDAEICPVVHDGHSLYRDNDHLSLYGGQFAGTHFLLWMAQQGIALSTETRAYAADVK